MDHDFGNDYIGYDTVRDNEGGQHNGRGQHSSGMNKFLTWSFVIMMAILGLIGAIAHFSEV